MTRRRVKDDGSAGSRIRLRIDATRQREILGVLLFACGAVLLLVLLHVTPSPISDRAAQVLRTFFGWGAFALPFLAMAGSAYLLRRGEDKPGSVAWGRILAAEIFFAAALAFVHLLTSGKDGAAVADSGEGGGYVGWAIGGSLAAVIGQMGSAALLAGVGLFAFPAMVGLRPEHLRRWSDALASRGADLADSARAAQGRKTKRARPASPVAPSEREPPQSFKALAPPAQVIEPSSAVPAPRSVDRLQAAPVPIPPIKPAEGQITLSPRPRPRRRGSSLPGLDRLDSASEAKYGETDANRKARLIEETLANFGIPAKVIEVNAGPTVTQFGLEPGFVTRRAPDGQTRQRKVSVSRIAALQHDLELALASAPIRIETPVPGRPIVGIEVPNQSVSVVSLRGVLESDAFKKKKSPLKIALGRDVSGTPVCADLAVMPHLLIAGATGSGKSVCINAIVACLLFNNSPDDLRLIMVDPKRVELVAFNNIPHLLGPVVVDLDEVVPCLRWVAREMDNRFALFAKKGVRNIDAYNEKAAKTENEPTMPYIIFLIDELADLMLVAPDETEKLLTRLAQMARATGIHLVIATQRPSVDVVTGLIKANFPARISFAVTSSVDSRVVLDTPGAEKLLGRGDMLYMASDSSKLMRLQGCFVSDRELALLVHFWRDRAIAEQRDVIQEAPWKSLAEGSAESSDEELVARATDLVRQSDHTSISFLQRKLGIGYPRAARLMDLLEQRGVVGPDEGGGKPRSVAPVQVPLPLEIEKGRKKKS